MDIQHLVDRLEEILNDSKQIPLTTNILVDEDRIYRLVDQMRSAIPQEIKQASRVNAERDRILAQAKEEAARIRDLAKQEAEELVNRDSVTQTAQQRADTIIERARREAEGLRADADAYVIDVLTKLEENLLHSISVVRNGLRKVQHDNQPSEQPAAD